MKTSIIFKKAHAMAKATIQAGDSYSATLAACLKAVYETAKNALSTNEFRSLQSVRKTTKSGATALMVKVGSVADDFLTDNEMVGTLFTKTKLHSIYMVTGRGKPFQVRGDYENEYVYIYVNII